jgi:hypothetical protein
VNPELADRAPAHDVAKRAAEAWRRREKEANDALDFLFLGNEDGRHDARCVHAVPCSRDYDPVPYPEATPTDVRMYEDTGIGALYGLPGGEAHAWQLAGWNVGRS